MNLSNAQVCFLQVVAGSITGVGVAVIPFDGSGFLLWVAMLCGGIAAVSFAAGSIAGGIATTASARFGKTAVIASGTIATVLVTAVVSLLLLRAVSAVEAGGITTVFSVFAGLIALCAYASRASAGS